MKKYIVYLFALCSLVSISCSNDDSTDTNNDEEISEFTIWDGPNITFTKEAGSDPTLEENQDRITDNVWITRSNSNGEIHNQVSENLAVEGSPAGTLWAIGEIEDIENLTFTSFRDAFEDIGNEVTESNLVLHLIEVDVYLPVRFETWGRGREGDQGAFSYTRATEPQ